MSKGYWIEVQDERGEWKRASSEPYPGDTEDDAIAEYMCEVVHGRHLAEEDDVGDIRKEYDDYLSATGKKPPKIAAFEA